MASNEQIIKMLKDDMRLEHGAVILYLQHAYYIGESGEACEIEAVARDEMRHFKWLAQSIVQLGGEPTLERETLAVDGTSPVDWMRQDVDAEDAGIAQYERHLASIDDPRIRQLIERIISDERAHRDLFVSLGEELKEEIEAGKSFSVPVPGGLPQRPAEIVDGATKHEYTVVLQYLLHSFMTPDHEASRELETVAINEMQHLGWFAELAAGKGHQPIFEHYDIDRGYGTADMVKGDLVTEKMVSESYSQQMEKLRGDESMADLVETLKRARDNENYHVYVFDMILRQLAARTDPQQRPGVGSARPQGQ